MFCQIRCGSPSGKGRKILDGERNMKNVNDIRKLWEKNIAKVDDEKKRKIDKKISNNEEISNQKVRNLIDGLQLDNNSVKIVKSPIIPKQRSSKFQSRLDAWVKRD